MTKFAGLALAVDLPARMEIVSPVTGLVLRDAAGEPAWLDLLSPDSAPVKAVQRRQLDRRLQTRAKLSAETLEAEAVELLVAACRGWRLLTLDGAPLDVAFGEASARELFGAPELSWLRKQADEFLGNAGNFRRT